MEDNFILIALGGNALKAAHSSQQPPQLGKACEAIAKYYSGSVLLTHGNGPQIGELALNEAENPGHSLDILGAETEGLLAYKIEQELSNYISSDRIVSVLTRVEVDINDSNFKKPSKPIGPWLPKSSAEKLTQNNAWEFIQSNGKFRRVVPSPKPKKILQEKAIKKLLDSYYFVICAGGGGVPVFRHPAGTMHGAEAVIDKDYTSSLLAQKLGIKSIYFLTDVEGVFQDWGTNNQKLLNSVSPAELIKMDLPQGSMGAKVTAACEFVENTGGKAWIGSLTNIEKVFNNQSGTRIEPGSL